MHSEGRTLCAPGYVTLWEGQRPGGEAQPLPGAGAGAPRFQTELPWS